RHEILRTRLVTDADGTPHQVIDPPGQFSMDKIDVTGEPDPRAALDALLIANARSPFDLAVGPLLRAVLIRLPMQQYVLALCLHHVLFDEWSSRILRTELSTLYTAFTRGEPDPLPALPIQYADYATWQRQWLTGHILDTQLHYWQTQLANPPILHLPTDRPRPPIRTTDGATLHFTIPTNTTTNLKHLSRHNNTTMFMTLLTAYTVLLHRHTGQTDLLIGTPIANRNQAETEHLIGFFVNTLALRTNLHHNPTFTELLHQTRTTALNAYTHQDLPFEQLVDELIHTRDRSQTPLIQTLFNYTATTDTTDTTTDPDTTGQPGQPHIQHDTVAKVDLALTVTEQPDGHLAAGLHYSTGLFDHTTIQRLHEHLMTLLDQITTNPDRPISQLDVLTPAERAQLEAWNATDAAVPAQPVHTLIAAHAHTNPDRPAVHSGEHTHT
ncbi:condensation domain-containing protein, partial [Dactylosporangium darangshiense]|uniref:condensation domain-containing protein n=1 Tax=Dactylosporangium darangshiense TaxID=579108 RepID=UPI0031F02EC3